MQIKPSDRRKLLLILLLAFALRITYVWIHERHVSEEMLARTAAYSYEQGWIARSLLWGKGFSSPKGGETGPTAMYTPVYPYILLVLFKVFGLFSRGSLLAALAVELRVVRFGDGSYFPGGETVEAGRGIRGGVAVGGVPERDRDGGFELDAGTLGAAGGVDSLGGTGGARLGAPERLGSLWTSVGAGVPGEPRDFLAALPFVLAWHCWRGRRQAAKYLRFVRIGGFFVFAHGMPAVDGAQRAGCSTNSYRSGRASRI